MYSCHMTKAQEIDWKAKHPNHEGLPESVLQHLLGSMSNVVLPKPVFPPRRLRCTGG